MTLNGVALILRFSPNSIALLANYVRVVVDRPIVFQFQSSTFSHNWSTLQRGLSAIAELLVYNCGLPLSHIKLFFLPCVAHYHSFLQCMWVFRLEIIGEWAHNFLKMPFPGCAPAAEKFWRRHCCCSHQWLNSTWLPVRVLDMRRDAMRLKLM